ncbi:phage tail spike protein [Anaerococcus vaginalis]|uniref:phage tail spike protein n=1 Tax=Anaerococcus vaginalis TaxID=33037 RepID=UPI00290AAB42|nr:phage tail spike protein [Anaerococcus vaginalis]MDU5253050.1 phage tail spike protein [Anaerococcus vaginalis]MDU6781635.1 phage tail spike protein [Anaerococcus vaginalis]
MIFFTNRGYETLAVASADTEEGLKLLDDELNQTIKTGTAIYNAKIAKNDKSVEKIEAGCFVFVPNFKNKMIPLEVMEVEEERSYKKIIAEDAGLELLNSDVGDHKMKGTLREHILATIGKDSDWTIGIDEIGDSKNLTLEYTGVSNQTKRIVQIAGRFGAEISYSFIFDGNEIKEKRINFVKERGENKAVRLEVGKELKDVKRNVSITNLRTAVLGVGKPHKETIKTTKTVKKTVNVNDTSTTTKHTNGKLDPFINWFQARKGKVRYSMNARLGPNSYDCSSAVHFAAKHAGLLPSNHYIGSTETLFSMKGKYLDEISRADIRYGDIFVAGRQGASGGAGGHTGAVIDKNNIIHCSYRRGIAITPINGYTGGPPVRWFRWRNSGYGSQTVSNRRYWTNSNVIYHDLGFNLGGLSASQLNNWIRATSPSSPFNGQGNVFMEAQKQSGLDARYILAHAALESGWGKSSIAKKYNNYFGIGAFDNDPNNAKNFSNSGLASGIINGAKWIAKNYYNSSYKQTTLYKMRNNNGVHQYATDPKWHNKIANIMKGSERYTSPAGPSTTRTVTQTVTESKEVDKDTNLKGYKYDDGRFFVDKDGRLCDREANAIWAKPNTKGKYLTRIYESEATSQKALFDECLGQLKKNNEPEISYDVNPDKIPKEIDIGDRVRIIDHDYSPALYLEARLVDVTTSSTNNYIDRAVFANFVPKTSGIAERLFNLQASVQDFKYSFENQPYVMSLESTSGNVFKDDIVDTHLIAKLTKAGIDQSANVDGYIWERISKYPDKLVVKDENWNENHKDLNEHFIELKRSDIELEATFVCSAMLDDLAVATASYTIKNFSIGVYKQKDEPDKAGLQWGDIWQWDDGDVHFKKIWKGDKWEDVITKKDLEEIELTPGPPGEKGKDGQDGKPGKDGKSGRLGKNLLLDSFKEAEGIKKFLINYDYAEQIEDGEELTLTIKIDKELEESASLSAYNGKDTLLGELIQSEKDKTKYVMTFNYIESQDDIKKLYIYLNNPTEKSYTIKWAVLARGDVEALDWYGAEADLQKQIDSKASEESLQDLQVHFAMYPTAEELNQNKVDLIKQQAYLDQLKTAIDSNALTLEERLSVIEANVGAGKLSLEAINTYLHFGEEGVLIGKEGEQVRLRLINNALEITDGTKVVARFANNQTETPNLKVTGAFEFGYHVANKVDLDGNKYTVISSNI